MRAQSRLLHCFALGVLLALSVVPAFCQAISAEQATSRAAAFAQALGMPWGEGTTAAVRENVSESRLVEWEISFHDFGTVSVDPNRGVVLSAVDYSAVAEHAEAKEAPKLDETAALARAQEIISLAGLGRVAQLEDPTVVLQESDPGVYRYVVYRRLMHHGIPCDIGGAQVMLSAADGRLLVLSAGLDVAAPESVTITVSEESATAAALEFAWQLNHALEPSETEAEVRIVVPNAYWTRWGLGEEIATSGSRVAWVVTIRDAEDHQRIFWIDAATGSLLGGTQSRSAVPRALTGPTAGTSTAAGHTTTESDATRVVLAALAALAACVVAVTMGLLLRARGAAR